MYVARSKSNNLELVKEVPDKKSQSILRSMWLIPGIVCAGLLMGSGPNITLQDDGSQITEVYNGTNGLLITNTTSYPAAPNSIEIVNPIWSGVHLMIFLILLVYVVVQMLTLFTKVN